ncbi:EamA family transporter [Candidatus Woesearchaeota archaeon]|nr:EamA family transporter [Candidatus Woesearchaeota archaeon]
MQTWILFTLIAELMWNFTSLFDKILLSKGHIKSPYVFIVFNGAMNVFLIFLLPFFDFGHLSLKDTAIAIAASMFLIIGIIFYYRAVQQEEISRVLMLWQLIPIFVLIISFLFIGETLTKRHFIGFLFLFAAGITISYKKINGKFILSKAFCLMLLSTLPISLYYIMSKHIYEVTDFWSAFMWLRLTAFSGILVLLIPSVREQFITTVKTMKSGAKGLIGFKMIVDFSAFMFLGYAMLNGPISLISALGSATAPMFIFFITVFTSIYLPNLVKEEIDRKSILTKIAAIALIIIGIVFVNL